MSDILTATKSWLNTPYRHQMSLRGVGCDCIGLIRGVWREVCGDEPWALPAYSPDWAEVGACELLLDGLRAHFTPVDLVEARPGDVIAFRMKEGAVAKHAAILSEGALDDPKAKIIHAYWGRAVVSSWLGPYWKRHIVGVFRFPEGPPPSRREERRATSPTSGGV